MESGLSARVKVIYAEKKMWFLQKNFSFGEFTSLLHQKTYRDIGLWLSILSLS